MTVTIELNNPLLLPKLQSWLKRNDAQANIISEGLDFEKFDSETKNRINTYYEAKAKGEAIKVLSLEQIMEAENV